MSQESVIARVSEVLREHGDLTVHYDPPGTDAATGHFLPVSALPLHQALADALASEYVSGLFRHQAIAIQQLLDGTNTVVATQTSSGKSLIYSAPVFDALLRDSSATSLFIYPQKALANDQHGKLMEIAQRLRPLKGALAAHPYFIARYDGSTPQNARNDVRAQVQIALTNPDMLHIGILQHHERNWARFFQRLKYVIIDECHEYRGIFGTNVAYVLRRLRQICDIHGSSPTFVATSATIREPREHLEKLTGVPFACVGPESDGSIQGRKKFWMVSGHDHFYDLGRKIALDLAKRGLSVLAFCPSRIAAEKMMARVLSSKDDELPFVKVYRAGLTAAEREAIEAGLRDKSVRLVFSTSALELGIDIGALDVVVCVGLPSSMMSLWQRSGRVARAGKEGAILLIPADTPIDSYYAAHPDELFQKENEPLALSLTNRRVVYCHYACAVNEVGGVDDRLHLESLGEAISTVAEMRASGALDQDIFYRSDPHSEVNIRSMGDGSYSLQCGSNEVGEIDGFHLLREAYRNAIYRHGGIGYRVKDVFKGKKVIRLDREYSWNETTAFIQKQIRLKRRNSVAEYSMLTVATVDVDVTEFIVNVVEKDRSGNVVQPWQGSAGVPAHTVPTVATQILIKKPMWDDIVRDLGNGNAKAALASCERLISSLFPTVSGPCDIQDFSSFSEILKDGAAAVYLYDNVYDGVDLTTGAFDKIELLIEKALERVTTCDCIEDVGCFRCIANPRQSDPTSKNATARLLRTLRDMIVTESAHVTIRSDDSAALLAPDAVVTCPSCSALIAKGDRFCKNCGHNLG
ncbi:MAG: DEAD/DEAH box helicase [Pirellulales bacterium]